MGLDSETLWSLTPREHAALVTLWRKAKRERDYRWAYERVQFSNAFLLPRDQNGKPARRPYALRDFVEYLEPAGPRIPDWQILRSQMAAASVPSRDKVPDWALRPALPKGA